MGKPKVLIISSVNPLSGPGVLALDLLSAFRKEGFECDLLTKDKCEKQDFLYVEDNTSTIQSFVNRIKFKFWGHKDLKSPYYFFYRNEDRPPVSTKKILNRLNKHYDWIVVAFWQGLLNYQSISELFDKYNCVFSFIGVDYGHMSGGCHFPGKCVNYINGCGACPAYNSNDCRDFTYKNIQIRKNIIEKVKPIVYGNSYMFSFYKQSYLLGNYSRLELSYPIINENIFSPLDKDVLREKYQVDKNVSFVIFFGCQSLDDKRKGMPHLLDALEKAYNRISDKEKDNVLLLIAGKDVESISNRLLFKYKYVGYVPQNQLPEMYSLSDVYLCSSVNDAGPMMVNQSLMCGTPVVGFEMGACLDVVKGRGTGYVAKLEDSDDLSNGILTMFGYHKDAKLYDNIRKNCRNTAMATSSYSAIVNSYYSAFKKYKSEEYE